MFGWLKKSLRARFTLVLFVVGVVPLISTSAFFYLSVKNSLFESVFRDLKWTVNDMAKLIEEQFYNARTNILIASQNTAFTMYFIDSGNRKKWVREQEKTLRHLHEIYADMLDEACFIESTGKEVCRIIHDRIAREDELSSGEDRNEFFREAFKMNEDEVFQGRPVISEDTKRFVIPTSTPIFVNGEKAAIFHFEITVTYFRDLLKKHINSEKGYGFIIDDMGNFVAHTRMNIGSAQPFPPAVTEATPPALKTIFKKILAAESGIEQFSEGGRDFYIVYRPVETGLVRGRNDNKWKIAYVIPAELVYVRLNIIKYEIFSLGVTLILVITLAWFIGNYVTRPIRDLAEATNKVAGGEMPRVEIEREDEIGALAASFNTMIEAVERRDEALKELSITDGLTGLYNHRHFKIELENAVKKADRYKHPMTLIMADVDFFKRYNDANGHGAGDMALKKIAEIFMKNTREVDLAARYGGEEFAVILPETGLEEAIKTADRIREKVSEEVFPFEEKQPDKDVTVSIGVALFPEEGRDAKSLIDAADKALYKAKGSGRNRVFSEIKNRNSGLP